jgi:hypothetical protein
MGTTEQTGDERAYVMRWDTDTQYDGLVYDD